MKLFARRQLPKKLGHHTAEIHLPHWLAVFYAGAATVLLPWTVVLAKSLPTRAVANHWDVTWGGFDIFVMCLLLLSVYFMVRKSLWIILVASALGTSLLLDGWFDVLTARPGRDQLHSIILAIFVEIPVALLSWFIALHAARTAIRLAQATQPLEQVLEETTDEEPL